MNSNLLLLIRVKQTGWILFLSCLFFIWTSCNSSSENKDIDKKVSKVFRYNQASGISSLDPAFAKDQANIWGINQLFNGLVQMDDKLNIRPCIAKSWDISKDGLTYTFHLNTEVYFHDNELFKSKEDRIVKAGDFVYSFDRLLDESVASTGAWLLRDKVAIENPFSASNDSTFVIKLRQAFLPMLGILSMQYCSVVPENVVKHYGKAFRANPIGTGPFMLKKWRENEILIMVKNPEYFEKSKTGEQLPYLDILRVSFMENKRNAFLKFKEGELDLLSGIDPAYKDELLSNDGKLKAEWNEQAYLLRSAYLNTEYLGFSMRKSQLDALQKKKVRQAINYAFDRKKMVRYLRNNIGIPAEGGFVPPGLPPFNTTATKGYSYNPAKAKDLLKEAGFPGGKGLPTMKLETTASYQEMCIFIQKELKELGIPVELEIHPAAFLRTKIAKGESNFFRASWIGDYPDAETYLAVLNGNNPAPPNYTQFKNADYDRYYQQALLEADESKRHEIYAKMDQILVDEAPIVPLFYDEVLRFVRKGVDGVGINAFNLLSVKNIRVSE